MLLMSDAVQGHACAAVLQGMGFFPGVFFAVCHETSEGGILVDGW